MSKIDKDALIEHLTAERDKAREEAGVYKYRMEHYQREMYIHLRISQERKAEVERLRDRDSNPDSWDQNPVSCH